MTGKTRQIIGTAVLTIGVVIFFNSSDFYDAGPYWLAGTFLILGVLLFAVGWKLIQRGRADSALKSSQEHDPQAKSSAEKPPETR